MIKAVRTRQICFFYIALMPVVKFFTAPSLICGFSGEDLWISAALNCLIDIITISVLYFLLKDENCDFFTLIERRCGTAFAKTVAAFYLVFFMLKTIMPLSEEKNYVELTLYITAPNITTFMPVFAAIFFLCVQRLRVIGRIADGVFIIALIGYATTFTLSASDTDFGAILPVGASGAKNIFLGAYSSSAWFSDGAYFLFFIGNTAKSKHDGLKIILSAALSALIVVAFMIFFYGTFTSIAQRQQFALTELSKYTTAINNMERFDYIPIFALLFTSVFSLALPFYFATELLTRIVPVKRFIAAIITCAIPAAVLLFTDEYFYSIENFILNFASGYFIFFGCVFPIAAAIFMKLRKKEKLNEIYGS